MSEFDQEVKKAEQELNEQSLVPVAPQEEEFNRSFDDEYLGDLKMQAQEYQQKFQDAAVKAKDYASEKFAQMRNRNKLKMKMQLLHLTLCLQKLPQKLFTLRTVAKKPHSIMFLRSPV